MELVDLDASRQFVCRHCHEVSDLFEGDYLPFFRFGANRASVEAIADTSLPWWNPDSSVPSHLTRDDGDSDPSWDGDPEPSNLVSSDTEAELPSGPEGPPPLASPAVKVDPATVHRAAPVFPSSTAHTAKTTLVLDFSTRDPQRAYGPPRARDSKTWGRIVATNLEGLHAFSLSTSIDRLDVVPDPKDHVRNTLVYIRAEFPDEPDVSLVSYRYHLDHFLLKCSDFGLVYDSIFVFIHTPFAEDGLLFPFEHRAPVHVRHYQKMFFTPQLVALFKQHRTHAFFSHVRAECFSNPQAYHSLFTFCTSVFDHTFFVPATGAEAMYLATPFVLRVVAFLGDSCASSACSSAELGVQMWSLLDRAGCLAYLQWFFAITAFNAPFRRGRYQELRKYVYLPQWAEGNSYHTYLDANAIGSGPFGIDPCSFRPLAAECPKCKKKVAKWEEVERRPRAFRQGSKDFQPYELVRLQHTCGERVEAHRPAEFLARQMGWAFEGFRKEPKVEGPGQWAVFSPRRVEKWNKQKVDGKLVYKRLQGV
ncbi:hypothetical protein SCHPADRAFT_895385 [Schizopora paradoxa]|uniref:Uncharacterized protein n=1 Tax=Schizopora paradoxa TaxID=27342 RepID=A0A0H2R3U9_9AGAM|nr:hypothetical protein SCHPADRAFT_895385 [Schizopora paradoxa]